MAAIMRAMFRVTMLNSGLPCGLADVEKTPAVTSSESPGRKNPTRRPVSANTTATRPARPAQWIRKSIRRLIIDVGSVQLVRGAKGEGLCGNLPDLSRSGFRRQLDGHVGV